MGQQRRRKSWLREVVVNDLHRNGPVEDVKGRAMIVLAQRVGHHSSMSVGNVIRALEAEGNATRVTAKDGEAPRDPDGKPSSHVRRTYRVALTDEFLAELPPVVSPEPQVDVVEVEEPGPDGQPAADVKSTVEGDYQMPENIDYDLVANAILGVVFKNLTASEEVQEVRRVREELAETKAALAEAKNVINALGRELKEERKQRDKIEDEAAALSLQVEELETQLKIAGPAKNNGWDKVPVDAYKELDKIMRAVPTARG